MSSSLTIRLFSLLIIIMSGTEVPRISDYVSSDFVRYCYFTILSLMFDDTLLHRP